VTNTGGAPAPTRDTPPRRKRAWPTNIALVAGGILVALVMAEVAFRVLGIAYPEFGARHDELGWAPIAGTTGTYAVEGRTLISINAEGFRDIDHPIAKPKNTLRIATLGDSFTEAREVALHETYWKVLEARLGECLATSGRSAEVLNFGVSGYGTAQEYLVLNRYVWKYTPDVVLLAVFTGNDIWNNSRALDGHERRPFFQLHDGALTLDQSNLTSSLFGVAKLWANVQRAIFNRVRVFQVIYQARRYVKYRSKYKDLDLFDQLNGSLNKGVYRRPEEPRWRQAWQVTEALFGAIAAATDDNGATLWLATLTNPIQVYPDARVRASLMDELAVTDLDYPDRRIARFATANGIRHVSLLRPLRAYAETRHINLHGGPSFAGGHWNATGHRAAGEALAAPLCAAYATP